MRFPILVPEYYKWLEEKLNLQTFLTARIIDITASIFFFEERNFSWFYLIIFSTISRESSVFRQISAYKKNHSEISYVSVAKN